MGPHTMLDEGIERCLDLIGQTAAVNAVMIYSHAFHGDLRKPIQFLAPDHGVPPRANRAPLPAVWVKHDARTFRNTSLRVKPTDPALEYANRDLFVEMVAPARRRGMKVYARILESSGNSIENFRRSSRRTSTAGRRRPAAGRTPTTRPSGRRWPKISFATTTSTACSGARSGWGRS